MQTTGLMPEHRPPASDDVGLMPANILDLPAAGVLPVDEARTP